MSMSKNEDDFWNSSASYGFNFDDEEDIEQSSDDFVFNSVIEEYSVVPIHTIISKNCLDLVLQGIRSANDITQQSVEETIIKMVHGQKYNLSIYRKFSDKTSLLENALQTFDGNVILNVILFLRQTLKANIFLTQLSKRRQALKCYAYYLILNNQLEELADMYMATDNASRMKQIYYLFGQDVQCKETLYKKQEQFMFQHLQKVNNTEDQVDLLNNVRLVTWQKANKSNSNSVIEQLAELCKIEVQQNKNFFETVTMFKKEFKIDDITFEWTIMNVLASMDMWLQLQEIFIKSNWLTKKNLLKTSLNCEIFINGLSRHNPPKNVIEQYLIYITDTEKALNMAKKLQCNNFVIHWYINQKDRQGLMNFKDKLISQTQEYFLAESALKSSDKKWKT